MPRVLVVVVTYNAMSWLQKCFSSLEASSHPCDVLVVDNGSTDGTVSALREQFPWVEVVEPGENLGFGAANNLGFKRAIERGYDYVYLLNQDAWLQKDTLAILLDAAQGFNGLLSPMQMSASGEMDANFARKCARYIYAAVDAPIVEVPFVMAAHWLLPVEVIKTVGGFSPAFKQYGEDDNYIDRLHYFDYEVAVVPAAKAVHDRANRKLNKAQRMRLKLVSTRVRLSRPWGIFFFRVLWEIVMLVATSVKNLSFEPIKAIPEIFRSLGEVSKYRKASKKAGFILI